MTQDEIIEMATQVYGECVWHESALLRLEAFVKLVAAREREECAKVCEESWRYTASAKEMVEYIQTKGQA